MWIMLEIDIKISRFDRIYIRALWLNQKGYDVVNT